MFEPAGTPTFLGLTDIEWHALGYGLKDGIKFWKRTHIEYEKIDELKTSDDIKLALKKKWHYYEIGSDLPEDLVLVGFIVWTFWSGQAQIFLASNAGTVIKWATTFFGLPF